MYPNNSKEDQTAGAIWSEHENDDYAKRTQTVSMLVRLIGEKASALGMQRRMGFRIRIPREVIMPRS